MFIDEFSELYRELLGGAVEKMTFAFWALRQLQNFRVC
jgi:hypothetical protein